MWSLTRTRVAAAVSGAWAPVIGDHAAAGLEQDGALPLPGVPVEREAVDGDDRLPGSVEGRGPVDCRNPHR